MTEIECLKEEVRSHWEQEPCGTRYGDNVTRREYFESISRKRDKLEPYIPDFAKFKRSRGLQVLEIGVGAGSDFHRWVANGAQATGIDLTQSAIDLTGERLELDGAEPDAYHLQVADAEHLPFEDNSFDVVYSWGVLHHSPNTDRCFQEAYRVLRPGGALRAMVYHVRSWGTLLLWTQHALLKGKPSLSAKEVLSRHLESPGTKAYTLREAHRMIASIGFGDIQLGTKLGPGDLLEITPSGKYQHPMFQLVWKFYPRWFVRMLGHRFGFYLTIEATKP